MSHPEKIFIYKNDSIIRSWKDLRRSPIVSSRHFDCALLVQFNKIGLGVYHHPASDSDGKDAILELKKLKKSMGQIDASCVIYKPRQGYSQAKLLHLIESSIGIKPKITDVDLSEFTLEEPVDISITVDGIFAEVNGKSFLIFKDF